MLSNVASKNFIILEMQGLPLFQTVLAEEFLLVLECLRKTDRACLGLLGLP